MDEKQDLNEIEFNNNYENNFSSFKDMDQIDEMEGLRVDRHSTFKTSRKNSAKSVW